MRNPEFHLSEKDREFSSEEAKSTEPKAKSRLRVIGERLARKVVLGTSLVMGLGHEQAMAQSKHHIELPKELKEINARDHQLNKWLEVFKIKTLGVLQSVKQEKGHEALEMYLRGAKVADLDSGGIIKPNGGAPEEVEGKAEKFDQALLVKYVTKFLESHTYKTVIPAARRAGEKEQNPKQRSKTPEKHRENIGGIDFEFEGNAIQVMEKTGVTIRDGSIFLSNKDSRRKEIDLTHRGVPKRVVIKATGDKDISFMIFLKNEIIVQKISDGAFEGTFNMGTK